MSQPTPHHRFTVHGQQGPLALAVEAALTEPWTILFGPSGSGKSTILRALAGLTPAIRTTFSRNEVRPEEGAEVNPSVYIWDTLDTVPPQARALAYAPQEAPLLPHLSVADNIRFPETLRRTPNAQSLLPELTSLLQLAPLLPKRPEQLSGGERQRVSLARALAVPNARLLLLDEPFAGLDRTWRDELLPRLQAHLAARNLPVLSVTHDADEALLLDAAVLRLDKGRITAQGPARKVLSDEVLRLLRLLYAKATRPGL